MWAGAGAGAGPVVGNRPEGATGAAAVSPAGALVSGRAWQDRATAVRSVSSVALAYHPPYFPGQVDMPLPPSLKSRKWAAQDACMVLFYFLLSPSHSSPGSRVPEGSLPKGPGASTYLPLKEARVALGGVKPTIALVCCSGFFCSPVAGESREQEGALTENRKQNQTRGHQSQASPEACQPAHCEPWDFSHREGGRKPARRLRCCHTARHGQAEAGMVQVLSWLLERSHSQPAPRSSLLGLFFALLYS